LLNLICEDILNITLEHLHKSFEDKKAVIKDINLEIDSGTLISLLGPSGCGKTTVLNIIAGLIKQSEGTVYFDGKNMNNIPVEKRNIGMVFQNYALYPHLSAFDNLAFPLQMQKLNKTEIKARVHKTAAFLEIDKLLHKKPAALSGGGEQRDIAAAAQPAHGGGVKFGQPADFRQIVAVGQFDIVRRAGRQAKGGVRGKRVIVLSCKHGVKFRLMRGQAAFAQCDFAALFQIPHQRGSSGKQG